MKKTIKLTERDLTNLVKRIIKEQRSNRFDDMSDEEFFKPENTPYKYGIDKDDIADYDQEYQDSYEKRKHRIPKAKEIKGFDKKYGVYRGSNMGLDKFPEELRNYSDDLYLLFLANNNITEIPDWISEFSYLELINLKGNPISHIPNSISELDPENGGSLDIFNLDDSTKIISKLKKLLPNVKINPKTFGAIKSMLGPSFISRYL